MSVLDVFNPNLGVAVREHSQAHSIIRLPRTESLRILPKSGMSDMFTALVACKELSRSSLKRGEGRKIFGDGTLVVHQCILQSECKHLDVVGFWRGAQDMRPFRIIIGRQSSI
jgi:hypothetical protein